MEDREPGERPDEASPSPSEGERSRGEGASRPRRRRDRSRGRRRNRPEATEARTSPVEEPAREAPAPKRDPSEPKRTRRRDRQANRRGGRADKTDSPAPVAAPVQRTPRASSVEPVEERRAPVRERSAKRPPRSRTATSSTSAPGRTFWIAVGLLTVIGVLVRLPGLNSGLWTDEIYSVMQSFRTPFPETLSVFPGDNKHPLYSLLAHLSLTAFGESAWSVRLPALALGVATIPALYALGVRITSRAESLAAAALLALSYHHVWFSQNARGYSALTFFAVVATWILLQALRSDEYRWWIWYGVAAGLGAYTHLTFVFTVVGQFLVVVAAVLGWPVKDRRISWRGPLAGFALSAVLALVLYLPMFSSVMAFFLHKQSNLRGISSPTWALTEAFRVLRMGFGGGGVLWIGLLVLGIGGAIGVAGAVSYARQNLRTFLLLVLPAVTTLMGAFAARGTMYPRFFFVLAGFALLIGIRGAFATGEWAAKHLRWSETAGHRLGAGLSGAVVLVSALSVPLNWKLPKQDFEGAARYAESSAAPGDAIVTADVTTSVYSTYFQKTWQGIHTAADLEGLRRADATTGSAGRRVWFVYAFPRYLERFDAGLAAYVREACTSGNTQRFPGTVGDGDLLVCRLERT